MGSADEAFIEITDDLNYPMLIVTAGAGGERAVCLAVHLVPARAPQLAELFGSHTGDETDKFDRCRWHAGPRDLPILDECARWFAGAILERRLLGDHWGYVLEPFAVHGRIETFATEVGDTETAELAKGIRADEERMAKYLIAELGRLVKELVRADIPRDWRATPSRRRAATSSRPGPPARGHAPRAHGYAPRAHSRAAPADGTGGRGLTEGPVLRRLRLSAGRSSS